MKFYQSTQPGFVILFAVMITAIMLVMGIGIFRIAFKETILSSTARESTRAFFASDSGVECALFYDVKQNAFNLATLTPSLTCANTSSTVTATGQGAEFRLALTDQTCAYVRIIKNIDPVTSATQTEIFSSGYNVCDQENPDTTNPLLLERQLYVRYSVQPATPPIVPPPSNPVLIP